MLILLLSLIFTESGRAGTEPSIFSSDAPVALELRADIHKVIAERQQNIANEQEDNAPKVFTQAVLLDLANPRRAFAAKVRARGNTSNQEGENEFPKLRIEIERAENLDATLFAGVRELRINTHVSTNPSRSHTDYGRLNNENSPWRESLALAMAKVVGLATPGFRPARITYTDTGASQAFTRNALLLETDGSLKKRMALKDVDPVAFSKAANSGIDPVEGAKFLLFHKLVGNIDVQLRVNEEAVMMTEVYRPLWNVPLFETARGRRIPFVYDLDLASLVTGKMVRNARANPSFGLANLELAAFTQNLATLRAHFTKAQLQAAYSSFQAKRSDLYRIVQSTAVDQAGRVLASRHLDLFFAQLPQVLDYQVVANAGVRFYGDAAKTNDLLQKNYLTEQPGTLHIGTPVKVLERKGNILRVAVLDCYRDLKRGASLVGYMDANAAIADSVPEAMIRQVDQRDMTLSGGDN